MFALFVLNMNMNACILSKNVQHCVIYHYHNMISMLLVYFQTALTRNLFVSNNSQNHLLCCCCNCYCCCCCCCCCCCLSYSQTKLIIHEYDAVDDEQIVFCLFERTISQIDATNIKNKYQFEFVFKFELELKF